MARGRGRGARRAWAGLAVAVAVGAAAAGAASADRGLAAVRGDRSGLSDDERPEPRSTNDFSGVVAEIPANLREVLSDDERAGQREGTDLREGLAESWNAIADRESITARPLREESVLPGQELQRLVEGLADLESRQTGSPSDRESITVRPVTPGVKRETTTKEDKREFSTTTEDEREFSTTTEDEREPPSDAETFAYLEAGHNLFVELRETREGASAGGYLFSPAQEAESWLCKAYGSHDGQNHEDVAVEVVCMDPETKKELAAPGFKKSGPPSGWTEEELLAPENELACTSTGGQFVTRSCGLTYLKGDGFNFEDFTSKFDRTTQGFIIDTAGEICCGGQNMGKKIVESDLCALYSGRAAVAADEVDRSRKLYGNKCRKDDEDITKTLEGFWGGHGAYSREVVLSSTNQEICKAAGGSIELETCGSFIAYYTKSPDTKSPEEMKFALDEVAPVCCPPRSDDYPMFTLEQEKESYLCKTWGYHDNMKHSQNIMDVKCKGAFGEELECSNIDGMKCSAAEGFSQEELASPANMEACETAVGGFENTPGSRFTTNTCEMAYMDNKLFSFEKYLSIATGDNKDTMRGYLNYIAPTCCGQKPMAQSRMCEKYSRGFDDEVDRSEKVLSIECQKRKNGDDFDGIDAPGFTEFNAFAGGDNEAIDWGQVLSTENNDACLAAGGDRVEVLTCEKAERNLSMYLTTTDTLPENVEMYLELTRSLCCPQSPEAKEERKKEGIHTEKDSFVCSNYGFHDGRSHAATVFSVSCKVGDDEIECDDIPGFACDATTYSEAELLSEENKAICEAHTDGATFEHLTCGIIFSPFYEAAVKSNLEDNPESLAATVGYLGAMCCGQKPMGDTKLCQGGKGGLSDEEMMTKDIPNRIVSAQCEKKGENDDDKTIFNVPGSVGFASSELDFEAARGVSQKEVTSKENQQKCFEAGGDHVTVTTCAKAADYFVLLPPGSIPAIYYDPVLKLCCPANGRETVPPGGGNFKAGCNVAEAVMKAAKDSSVMGAPALRGPGLKDLGWNLDTCRAPHAQ